jgi:hypothetical protein
MSRSLRCACVRLVECKRLLLRRRWPWETSGRRVLLTSLKGLLHLARRLAARNAPARRLAARRLTAGRIAAGRRSTLGQLDTVLSEAILELLDVGAGTRRTRRTATAAGHGE